MVVVVAAVAQEDSVEQDLDVGALEALELAGDEGAGLESGSSAMNWGFTSNGFGIVDSCDSNNNNNNKNKKKDPYPPAPKKSHRKKRRPSLGPKEFEAIYGRNEEGNLNTIDEHEAEEQNDDAG